jgi:hypothetical protein
MKILRLLVIIFLASFQHTFGQSPTDTIRVLSGTYVLGEVDVDTTSQGGAHYIKGPFSDLSGYYTAGDVYTKFGQDSTIVIMDTKLDLYEVVYIHDTVPFLEVEVNPITTVDENLIPYTPGAPAAGGGYGVLWRPSPNYRYSWDVEGISERMKAAISALNRQAIDEDIGGISADQNTIYNADDTISGPRTITGTGDTTSVTWLSISQAVSGRYATFDMVDTMTMVADSLLSIGTSQNGKLLIVTPEVDQGIAQTGFILTLQATDGTVEFVNPFSLFIPQGGDTDSIYFDNGSTITLIERGDTIVSSGGGSGSVDTLYFDDGITVTPLAPNDTFSIIGPYPFEDTGVRMPSGTTAERNVSPRLYDLWINTDSMALEFWNGASWVTVSGSSGGGGGEINSGVNIGTAGVGVFDSKSGVLLQFRNINAGSSKVTVTDDSGNDEIDIDIVPGNINTSELNNDAGFLTSENDGSTTNETITDVSISNDSLLITEAAVTWNVVLDAYLDNTDTQDLSIDSSGTVFTVSLVDGGSVIFDVSDNDNDSSNEGDLIVLSGTATTSVIQSNTSGSTDVTLEVSTGLTISEAGNTITFTNAAPDQTVVLNDGGIVTVTGTYPNFTITATELDGATDNEIQQHDSSYIVGTVFYQSLSLDGVSADTTDFAIMGFLTEEVDADTTNELNETFVLNGQDLELTDPGGTLTVDLSSISGGVISIIGKTVTVFGYGNSYALNSTDSSYANSPEVYQFSQQAFVYDPYRDSMGYIVESESAGFNGGAPLNAPAQMIGLTLGGGQGIDRVNDNTTWINQWIWAYLEAFPYDTVKLVITGRGAKSFTDSLGADTYYRDSAIAHINEAIAADIDFDDPFDFVFLGIGPGEGTDFQDTFDVFYNKWAELGYTDESTTWLLQDAPGSYTNYNRQLDKLIVTYSNVNTTQFYRDSLFNDFDGVHPKDITLAKFGPVALKATVYNNDATPYQQWKPRFDQAITAGLDGYVWTLDYATLEGYWEVAPGAGGGMTSWTLQTDSGVGNNESITDGETAIFLGGDGMNITNSGATATASIDDSNIGTTDVPLWDGDSWEQSGVRSSGDTVKFISNAEVEFNNLNVVYQNTGDIDINNDGRLFIQGLSSASSTTALGLVADSVITIDLSSYGTMTGFNWGDGSSTTLIEEGETVQVTGSNGINAVRSGNDVNVLLNFVILPDSTAINSNMAFAVLDQSSSVEATVDQEWVQDWIETFTVNNSLYTGSGSLSGPTIVTGGSNGLTMTGLGAFTTTASTISLTSTGAASLSGGSASFTAANNDASISGQEIGSFSSLETYIIIDTDNNSTTESFEVGHNAASKIGVNYERIFNISESGLITADLYGSGSNTDTVEFLAAWDQDGNFIETDIGGTAPLLTSDTLITGDKLMVYKGATGDVRQIDFSDFPTVGGGSGINSFYFGEESSWSQITDGDSINIVGGANGVDIIGGGTNSLAVNLDLGELFLQSSVVNDFQFVGWDSGTGIESRITKDTVQEWIQDQFNSWFIAGDSLTGTYNDVANTYTLDYTGVNGGGGSADGVATAGSLDAVNEEIDMTVAAPGSNFSINLADLSTMDQFSAWDQDDSDDITGSGASGQVAYFDGTQTITSEAPFLYNATENQLKLNDGLGDVITMDADDGTIEFDYAPDESIFIGLDVSSNPELSSLTTPSANAIGLSRTSDGAYTTYFAMTGDDLIVGSRDKMYFVVGQDYDNRIVFNGTGLVDFRAYNESENNFDSLANPRYMPVFDPNGIMYMTRFLDIDQETPNSGDHFIFYNGAEFRGIEYDSLFVNANVGSFDSFTWGDGSSTTLIETGETIQVIAGTDGIDGVLNGNDLELSIDFSEFGVAVTVQDDDEIILYDSGSGAEQRISDENFQTWIEGFISQESTVASNGLTLVGSDVQLGGTQTGNVTINGDGNLFTITNNSGLSLASSGNASMSVAVGDISTGNIVSMLNGSSFVRINASAGFDEEVFEVSVDSSQQVLTGGALVILDSNNDNTDRSFEIGANATTTGGGTFASLLKVNESGTIEIGVSPAIDNTLDSLLAYNPANNTVYAVSAATLGGGGGSGGGTTEYYFSGRSVQTAAITLDTWTDITWTTELKKDASFTHSTGTDPEEITIDSTGVYTFEINARFDQNGDGRIDQYVQVWKDIGAGFTAVPDCFFYEGTAVFSAASIAGYSIGGSATIELNAGDVVKFRTYIDLIGSNGANDPLFVAGTNCKITRIE